MKIQKNGILGWWFWWGYWEDMNYREVVRSGHIDLCSFMRTLLLWAPLKTLVCLAGLAGFVYVLGFMLIGPFYGQWVGFAIFSTIAITILLVYIGVQSSRKIHDSETGRVFAEWAKAKKEKYCPIITIGE